MNQLNLMTTELPTELEPVTVFKASLLDPEWDDVKAGELSYMENYNNGKSDY